ncbi:MAG: glutamate formiminotransferase [Acidimicrobiales bacterium]|nr:glutamate formiminotransferase [Acidimicrobiales bacterium]
MSSSGAPRFTVRAYQRPPAGTGRVTRSARSPRRARLARVLECVVNVSEGRRPQVVRAIAGAAGRDLLDVHTDPDHHRTVLTLLGEGAVRSVARASLDLLDLGEHQGAHPRIGVLDVVPFVPLGPDDLAEALSARDRFARWAGSELQLPCFLYGPERSLPDVRRHAFAELAPDTGPAHPHPTAGACAVGARAVLVAYNLWLAEPDASRARAIARDLRGPAVRALGLVVGREVQVSCNLVAPLEVGPAAVYDAVAARAPVARAELVGLVPAAVLAAIPRRRWDQLDLDPSRTIEARIAARRTPR